MTKKEYCLTHPVIAFYSLGLCGLEIRGVENGMDDYLYANWCAPGAETTYHRLKIYNNCNGSSFIRYYGHRIPLSECEVTR